MNQQIVATCNQAVQLLELYCQDQNDQLSRLAGKLAATFTEGGQLLIAANGCLQPVAQLMASQFVFRLSFKRPVLPTLCLGSDQILNNRIHADGQDEHLFVRHYRAINSQKHLLLLLNDGSDAAPLNALRDEVQEAEQEVALISFDCRKDPLMNKGIEICLNLGTSSVPRQIELAQFSGHLLCELVESELFGN
ncbi:MAG: SIS domain-containing protein [Desulfuromonadales bacterium]|nr:SIS domain-containing protein [Desulfuromonadales bacterium]MBN2793585.1 SIS domain-containing protein [Desulfuromonadales bacterium]